MQRIKIEKDFDLRHIFDCGQCFRFNEEKDGSFTGVAYKKAVHLKYENGELIIDGIKESDLPLWEKFLDIKRDYSKIKERVSITPYMKEAVEYGHGIRILKQDFFETLLSFIISQRSSIPKIKSSVEKLCKAYGEKIELRGKEYYTFPTPEALSGVKEEDYVKLGVGYRAKYLEKAVASVLSGEISEEELIKMPTSEARKKLLTIYGVGNKVADCILLFSLAKFDSFPVDVWIDRAMKEDFGGKEGYELFGEDSGFAQQYIFYKKRYDKEK